MHLTQLLSAVGIQDINFRFGKPPVGGLGQEKMWINTFLSFERSTSRLYSLETTVVEEIRQNVWLPGWWYSYKYLCFDSALRGF